MAGTIDSAVKSGLWVIVEITTNVHNRLIHTHAGKSDTCEAAEKAP